jgi:hypothetical protein
MDDALRSRIGFAAFACFLASIPLANWMIGHVGTTCVPSGPCLVPVAPGLLAPSGVLTVGAALVLRDVVQRCLGLVWGLLAIGIGTVLSALVVDSVVFLGLAFGSLDFLLGQVVGKLWAVLIAIPLMRLLRRVAPTPA